MSELFRVGMSRDFLTPTGEVGWGEIGLGMLDAAPGVTWEFLAEPTRELAPEHIAEYDAVGVLGPRVTERSLAGAERLAVVARFGVGYDTIDVDACTRHGVAVTNTPDGVRRPMASATLTFVLALSHRLFDKDRLTRTGGWADKLAFMGYGLTGKTVGMIGFGNVGREVARLLAPFDVRRIACDPYVAADVAVSHGVEFVDLETLLREADFVVTLCNLTSETHRLLNAERIALIKPTAFLVSMARGPIVDQAALTEALRERRIRGAALDVFDPEPVDPADPILTLDNVILAPHALCWTDEMARGVGRSVMESILAVAAGEPPRFIVNRAVLDSPRFQEKLARLRALRRVEA
ncbi:MAG: NAD(P)-dependent oxidoreductase [Thermomicrobiales bacterium]